jgi:TRAP-type C4-dicarboxylate transport system permease large subunit
MVLLVIGCAAAFGWLLAFLRCRPRWSQLMQAVSDNPS